MKVNKSVVFTLSYNFLLHEKLLISQAVHKIPEQIYFYSPLRYCQLEGREFLVVGPSVIEKKRIEIYIYLKSKY